MKYIKEFNFWPFKKTKNPLNSEPVFSSEVVKRSFTNDKSNLTIPNNSMGSSDVFDIEDIFKDMVAIEYGLVKALKGENLNLMPNNHLPVSSQEDKYVICLSNQDTVENGHIKGMNSNIVHITIRYHRKDVETFTNSLYDFLERIRSIGYKCRVYQIRKFVFNVVIWNDTQ